MTTDTTHYVTNGEVLQAVYRLEDKLGARLESQDTKLDSAEIRLARIEGGLAMVRWLGPSGVAALVFGVLKMSGVI